MEGVVFTAFLERVKQRFPADPLVDAIHGARMPHAGVDTTFPTHPHAELPRFTVEHLVADRQVLV